MEPVSNRLIHELGCNLFQSDLTYPANQRRQTVESTPPDTAPSSNQHGEAFDYLIETYQ